VIRDKAILARISRESKDYLLKYSSAGLLSHHLQEIVSDPTFDIFYRAPVLILISSAAESPWSLANCALAAENLMLAACAAGLGSCWIGFAQAWLGTPEGKTLLDLPSAYVPVARSS
jgi:nitroreductase